MKNHRTSTVEQLRRRRYSQRYHKNLKVGVRKGYEPERIQEEEKVELFQHPKKKDIQDTTFGNRTTYLINGGRDQNCKPESRIKPMVPVQVGITKLQQGRHMFRRMQNILISFLSFYKDFKDKIQSIEGVMLRGQDEYMILNEQSNQDRD